MGREFESNGIGVARWSRGISAPVACVGQELSFGSGQFVDMSDSRTR